MSNGCSDITSGVGNCKDAVNEVTVGKKGRLKELALFISTTFSLTEHIATTYAACIALYRCHTHAALR